MRAPTVLAADDDFLLPALFANAVRSSSPGTAVREREFTCPDLPFGDVAEVSEAAGAEEPLAETIEQIVFARSSFPPNPNPSRVRAHGRDN